MKTINILTAIIVLMSLNSFADDKVKDRGREKSTHMAYVFDDRNVDVPTGLSYVKAKNALVPVAPFVWGSPEETVEVNEKRTVAVAPFVWGNPDESAPAGLQVKAVNARVPVAPFVWGNPDAEAPTELAVGRLAISR